MNEQRQSIWYYYGDYYTGTPQFIAERSAAECRMAISTAMMQYLFALRAAQRWAGDMQHVANRNTAKPDFWGSRLGALRAMQSSALVDAGGLMNASMHTGGALSIAMSIISDVAIHHGSAVEALLMRDCDFSKGPVAVHELIAKQDGKHHVYPVTPYHSEAEVMLDAIRRNLPPGLHGTASKMVERELSRIYESGGADGDRELLRHLLMVDTKPAPEPTPITVILDGGSPRPPASGLRIFNAECEVAELVRMVLGGDDDDDDIEGMHYCESCEGWHA